METEPKNFKEFIRAHKADVHGKICDYLSKEEPVRFTNEIMPVYVNRLGQYRRPSYLMLWSMLYGGNVENALLPAAVQQLSEDWILMHDDIMDNNELRRGQPSAHKLFGSDYAILGGDALHVIMWKMAHEAATSMQTNGQIYFNKAVDIILKTVYGQYKDVRLTKEVNDITKFTKADYYDSIYAKSAYYSVSGPMQTGAIIAGADAETIEHISDYGTPIGNAFQIKDDILDCTATAEKLGKTIGNDVMEGTKTLILWHSVQNASTGELERLKMTYARPRSQKTEEDRRWVIELFNNLGSIEYAQEEANDLAASAAKKFNENTRSIKESSIKDIARDSIGYAVSRKE